MEKLMETSTSANLKDQMESTSRSSVIGNLISSAAMNLLNLDSLINDAHNIHQEHQQQEQQQHNQHHKITFEVPTKHDLLHIETLHQHQQNLQKQQQQHDKNSLNNILERFGDAALEVFSSSGITNINNNVNVNDNDHNDITKLSGGITNEQLSKSVVLNLSDMKATATSTVLTTATSHNHVIDDNFINNNWLENLFGNDVDVHTIINYLWIGVVCALLILSLVFIMFSVYFYRKFRIWKQCNKDIRAQLQANGISSSSSNNNHNNNNNNNTITTNNNIIYNSEAALLSPCLSNSNNNNHTSQTAYYQMTLPENTRRNSDVVPPPCYTIATGLPTYDEALHRQHFTFGMRFLYPSMSVLSTSQQQPQNSNWQKEQFSEEQQQQQQKLLIDNAATTSADILTTSTIAATSTQLPPTYTEALLSLAMTRRNSISIDNSVANGVSSVYHKKCIEVATLTGEHTANISTISDENISTSSNINDFVIDLS